jgi:hypothetical protein
VLALAARASRNTPFVSAAPEGHRVQVSAQSEQFSSSLDRSSEEKLCRWAVSLPQSRPASVRCRTGPALETIGSLQKEAHLSGLQLSKLAALDPGTLPVVPGVSLTHGEAFLQQTLLTFVPRGPLGLDPPWISLEAQPTFVTLFRPQPLGPGAQSGTDSVAFPVFPRIKIL